MESEFLLLQEVLAADSASAAFVLAVCAPHVAVVSRMGGKGFAAVSTLEGLLSRVLADVSAQDAGGSECLKRRSAWRGGEKSLEAVRQLSRKQSPKGSTPAQH